MARKRRGRDEGSICQREQDGLWVASISLGYDASGKRIRKTVYGTTKTEAKEKMLAMQQDALNGIPVKPEKLTLDQHFEDWLRVKKAEVRTTTIYNYTCVYNANIKLVLGHVLLKDICYRQINALYESLDGKGLSKRSVGLVAFLLRSALEDAVRKGIAPNNQAKLAAPRKMEKLKEARYLNQEDIKDFLEAAEGERTEDAFILLLHTGLRFGELGGLSWDAVDWQNKRLTIKQALHEQAGKIWLDKLVKTEAGRRVLSLSDIAIAALKRQKKRQSEEQLAAKQWNNADNLVFTNIKGGLLSRLNVQKRDLRRMLYKMSMKRLGDKAPKGRGIKYDNVIKQAGLDGITHHTFRHTHASILIFQGCDPKTIAGRLGHTDVAFTLQTYVHLFPGKDESAAEKTDSFFQNLAKK